VIALGLSTKHILGLCSSFSFIKMENNFRKVFEVITKVDASNMAYASGGELPVGVHFKILI
jgi:hypothetical protein